MLSITELSSCAWFPISWLMLRNVDNLFASDSSFLSLSPSICEYLDILIIYSFLLKKSICVEKLYIISWLCSCAPSPLLISDRCYFVLFLRICNLIFSNFRSFSGLWCSSLFLLFNPGNTHFHGTRFSILSGYWILIRKFRVLRAIFSKKLQIVLKLKL